MTGNKLVPFESEELQKLDRQLVALRPDLAKAPVSVRWATITLARIHGLDPLQKEVIPIESKGTWEPYVTLKGARRVADLKHMAYGRVLSPLSDKWTQEFFGMTAKELRQAAGLKETDIVWLCAIVLDGRPYPFVELGVVGESFPYRGSAPAFKMAAIRAERSALLAACNLPYDAGFDGANGDVEEEPVEAEVTELPAEEPEAEAQRTEEDFCADVATDIPYYRHGAHVANTLKKLGLTCDPTRERELALWETLNDYASKRANEKAAKQPGQQDMFEPEEEAMPF